MRESRTKEVEGRWVRLSSSTKAARHTLDTDAYGSHS